MKQLNWYQIFGKSNIPDGRTVLPTDDIQIWLHCANIWDKTYTTLAEVLADTTTLSALITSNNAVDYMVRSTTWAVASALVPTMTDNTHPSGECSASSVYDSRYPVYKAFDKNNSTEWVPTAYNNNSWIQYKFDDSVTIFKFKIKVGDSAVTDRSTVSSLVVSSGDSEGTLNTVASYSPNSSLFELENTFTATQGQYWRVTFTHTNNARYTMVPELQFYSEGVCDNVTAMTYIGQNNYAANTLLADATWCEAICNSEYFESVLNVKVPVMTSNTTPSGYVASARTEETSSRAAYKAFNNNMSDYYCSAYGNRTQEEYLDFEFPEEVTICHVVGYVLSAATNMTITTRFEYYSGGSWVVIDGTEKTVGGTLEKTYDFTANVKTNKMRVRCLGATADSKRLQVNEIQYYGRKDI